MANTTDKIKKTLIGRQVKRMKESAINGAKNFLSLNEINYNLDNYIDKLLNAEDYLKACLLLEQDFKEKIELFLDDKFDKVKIYQFIHSSYLLGVIDYNEFTIYNEFNGLRILMAHNLIKKIRMNKLYVNSSYKNWLKKINNFREIRFIIYKKLLINLLKKEKLTKEKLKNIFILIVDIVYNENIEKINKAINENDTINARVIIMLGVEEFIEENTTGNLKDLLKKTGI